MIRNSKKMFFLFVFVNIILIFFLLWCNSSDPSQSIYYNYSPKTNNTIYTTTSSTFNSTPVIFKVMTYNMHFLGITSSIDKFVAIGQVIKDNNPDIIACQELYSNSALQMLYNILTTSFSMDYKQFTMFEGDYVNNGLISKFDLPSDGIKYYDENISDPYGQYTGYFARKLLQATVKVNDVFSFVILVTHLKAMNDDNSFAWRRAEAYKMGQILREQLLPNYPHIIFAGDLNNIVTTGTITDYNTTLNYLELTDDTISANDFSDIIMDQYGTSITTVRNYSNSVIDHQLLSPEMKNHYIANSVAVANTGSADNEVASDHFPVIAEYYSN